MHTLLRHLNTMPWNYQPDPRPAIARAEVSYVGANGP